MRDPVRQIVEQLAHAPDEQVARIVALVDAMAIRGDADALVAPLRSRLSVLRPARKPRFGRVLFTPLDPVIVPAEAWRGQTCTVPRSALPSIEALVRAGLGTAVASIEIAIARLPGGNPARVHELGARLWKPAASIVRDARMPPGWIEAGLPERAFAPMRRAVAAVLVTAAEIGAWLCRPPHEPPPTGAALQGVLGVALPLGSGACGMLGAVLLARFPSMSGAILAALTALHRQDSVSARIATDLALGAVVGNLESTTAADVATAPLADAARSIQAAAGLLKALIREAGPGRRERLTDNRADLDERCRARFSDALKSGLLAPLRILANGRAGTPTAAQAIELERAARDLRHFEHAARQLGGGSAYDDALRSAAGQVEALSRDTGQTLADRVRLVEILAELGAGDGGTGSGLTPSRRQVHPLDPQEVLAEDEDAARTRRDHEALKQVQRHAERMSEHRLDYIGMGDRRHLGVRKAVAQRHQGGEHAYLDREHRLPAGRRGDTAEPVEGLPGKVLVHLREAAAGPSPEVDLVQAGLGLDLQMVRSSDGPCRLLRTFERTRHDRSQRSASKRPSKGQGLRPAVLVQTPA